MRAVDLRSQETRGGVLCILMRRSLKPPSIHAAPPGQLCSERSRRLESTPPPGDVTDAACHTEGASVPLPGTVPAPPPPQPLPQPEAPV